VIATVPSGKRPLDIITPVTLSIVNDLEALTFGAQFRSIGNVKVGQNAIDSFFNLMKVLLAATIRM
jgi:hypothetical protein